VANPQALSREELEDLLTRSHQLVAARLPKKQRIALLL
jgi:predicted DNA-binding protein (MmcQ/YjbR family)